MNYLVHMTDPRGINKVKIVDAFDVKEASEKAQNKYPSYEIGRITNDRSQIEYYMRVKYGQQK